LMQMCGLVTSKTQL